MAVKTVSGPNNEDVVVNVDPLLEANVQRLEAAQKVNEAANLAELNRINNAGSAAKAGYGGGNETPPVPKKVKVNDQE